MGSRLMVGVLGNRNSGKSTTWYTAFNNPNMKTSNKLQKLYFNNNQYVDVILVNGSPQERKKEIKDIIGEANSVSLPQIILCSLQYDKIIIPTANTPYNTISTLNWFYQNDYDMYIHWLNPGFSDPAAYTNSSGFVDIILDYKNSNIGIRDGKKPATNRVYEMKDFIYGWASSRGIVKP